MERSRRLPDPEGFKSGRHFAAWLGLTPKPHSSGGKERLGGISKSGESDAPLAACLWRDVGLATREGQ
ncbi:transposase [Bradyrhizobium sp. SSUT18]|uniref:transposase n=1 Tax=Bradyrhizobium sp. SSUT18 TaxID=3040602 RepID=UPI003264BDCA